MWEHLKIESVVSVEPDHMFCVCPHLLSTKMLTQGPIPSTQKFYPILCKSYRKASSKQVTQRPLLSHEMDTTWFQSPKIT